MALPRVLGVARVATDFLQALHLKIGSEGLEEYVARGCLIASLNGLARRQGYGSKRVVVGLRGP